MFTKFIVWYWKWFKPSKWARWLADELVAAYQAGLEAPDPETVEAVAAMAGASTVDGKNA